MALGDRRRGRRWKRPFDFPLLRSTLSTRLALVRGQTTKEKRMTIQVRSRVRVLAAACAVALTLASPAALAWPGVHPPDDTENPVITWDLNAQTAIWDVANQDLQH
jgi:hypothetical protein